MLNNLKLKRKPQFSKILKKYHFIFVTLLVLLIFAADGLFLYRYFYQGLTESRLILELKQEVLLENLNLKTYTELLEFNEKRQKSIPPDWDTLRDPFVNSPISSSGSPQR